MKSSSTEAESRDSRRRGRSRRAKQASVKKHPNIQKRQLPVFELLSESSLIELEKQADWLLENVGMVFSGDAAAIELFRGAGATVDGERLTFEPGLVRSLCSTAPQQFELYARSPEHKVTVGDNHVVLMPGYGSPFVTDLTEGRRYATIKDFENFVKLAHLSNSLHHTGGTVCEPTDVPVNKRHLDMVYAHLRLSTKPFMGAVTTPRSAHDSLAMTEIVFGREYMETHAVIQGNINVNSPFVFDGCMSEALRVYAEANQCVCVSPAIFGGAMGPVSPAAMSAQTLAEGMVGIALAQLVRQGCPVVLGSFHSTMNLRSGALTFGTPEANLVTMAISQLGRRLRIPVRSGGGQITASNIPDGQAMMDSCNAMWATLISGANQVWHAAGWLEGGLTMSYEKFIMDLDNCGSMMRLLQGFAVSDETLARDSYYEVEPGANFLSTSHTMRHFAHANYESLIPDSGPFEHWKESGCLTADQRANRCYKSILRDYEMPDMDSDIELALKEFIAERKQSLPDAWY